MILSKTFGHGNIQKLTQIHEISSIEKAPVYAATFDIIMGASYLDIAVSDKELFGWDLKIWILFSIIIGLWNIFIFSG